MVMLMDNILSGLGRESGGSRGSSSVVVTEQPAAVDTSALHQTGTYSSDGSRTYSNSRGDNYTVDANGNVTYYKTESTERQPMATVSGEDAEDNMLLWVLLPILALVGVKMYKNMSGNRSTKKRKR